MNAVISIKDLIKQFGGRRAVDGLSLQVPRGGIFALLGDNGAGKTTTIRMLTGLLAPDAGRALVLGQDCWKEAVALRHRIGYVPERPRFYDWMTIAELGWFTAGFHHPGFLPRFLDRIAHFELDPDKRLAHLSKGQYAKVGLALALAHEPEVLILDEPTSGLDLLVRREFLAHIVGLAAEGRTILISSHQIAEVERVASHAAFLAHGRLLLAGTLDDLRQRLVRLSLRHEGHPPDADGLGTILQRNGLDGQWQAIVLDPDRRAVEALRRAEGVSEFEETCLGLEEAYCALMARRERPAMMFVSLAWKEFREGWSIWLSLALIGTGSVFLTPMVLELLGESEPREQQMAVLIALIVLTVTYGVVTGSMLLAGERESRTLAFLDALTARRSRVWASKVVLGLLFAFAQGIALTVPFVLGAPRAGPIQGTSQFWLLPILAVEATAWGLFSSSFGRSVLGSAGFGGLLQVLNWGLTFAMGGLGRRVVSRNLRAHVLLDVLALALSYWIFCRPDRKRARPIAEDGLRMTDGEIDNPQAVTQHPQWSNSDTRGGWRELAWLAWRQGRPDVVVLVPAALGLGLAFAPYMVGSWLLWTLLAGIVFGTGVWRPEQAEGSYRFLICQRLPPGRVWVVKTAFGLGAAGLVVAAGLLGIALHLPVMKAIGAVGTDASVDDFGPQIITLFGNAWVVALIWVLHGFAAGQLFTLLCPKNLVAVMVSLPVSIGLVGPWLPSLVIGGLPAWQLFVVPALLLLASRLVLWTWAGERLLTRKPALSLAACGLLAVGWVIGCLAWRALEVPDVGEPFDVASFRTSLPSPDQNEAGDLIRKAMNELADYRKDNPPPRAENGSVVDEASVVRRGWDSAPPGFAGWLDEAFRAPCLAGWLDEAFRAPWKFNLEEGVTKPRGRVVVPRLLERDPPLGDVRGQEPHRAALLYRLRAMQLQARKDDRAALNRLQVPLLLSQHLRNKAISASFLLGLEAEDEALGGLEEWARTACDDSILMREALKTLDTYENELPPVEDVLKSHYLIAEARLIAYYSDLAFPRQALREAKPAEKAEGQMFQLAQQTPWESARTERLVNAQYAAAFKDQPFDPSWERRQWWLRLTGPDDWARTRLAAKRGLCRLHAVQLELALLLYERENKKPARSLADLVPKYLEALSKDPFSRRDFHYRVSTGESIPVIGTGKDTVLKVAEGQGVLWSTGPDGADDGGRVQGLDADSSEVEKKADWIFLVPRARPR